MIPLCCDANGYGLRIVAVMYSSSNFAITDRRSIVTHLDELMRVGSLSCLYN